MHAEIGVFGFFVFLDCVLSDGFVFTMWGSFGGLFGLVRILLVVLCVIILYYIFIYVDYKVNRFLELLILYLGLSNSSKYPNNNNLFHIITYNK